MKIGPLPFHNDRLILTTKVADRNICNFSLNTTHSHPCNRGGATSIAKIQIKLTVVMTGIPFEAKIQSTFNHHHLKYMVQFKMLSYERF